MGLVKPILQEIIKWLLSVSWLLFNSADSWAQNAFKTALLTLASMITFLIISALSSLSNFKRPFHVMIQFKNVITKDPFTYYHAKSESNQQQRTVRIEVSVAKRSSFWTTIVNKYFIEKECWINIETLHKGDFILQCNPNLIVEKTEYGLKLRFSNLLKDMLIADDANMKHEIDFCVFKSREAGLTGNREIDIVPICFFDDKKIRFWHKFLYKIDIEQHKIRYFSN